MKNLFNLIKLSLNGQNHDVSAARLQSYLIILPILLLVITFLLIEIWSFMHSIQTLPNTPYHLSNEIIIIFGMLLAHHLSILFSRNKPTSITDVKSSITTISGVTTEDKDADPVT
jgi:uncharacterized membrane protein YwaF